MARKKKIEIFKLEDRVLFEAAGAVEAIAAESLAEDANPDQQNEISESERQEKEAQSVAKDAGPATVNEPGKTVQEVGGGLFQKKSEQQNPNQVLPDDHAVFSGVTDPNDAFSTAISNFLNTDFSEQPYSADASASSDAATSDTRELLILDAETARDFNRDLLSENTEILVLDNDSDAAEQVDSFLESGDAKYDSIKVVGDADLDTDVLQSHLTEHGELVLNASLDFEVPADYADDPFHDTVIHPEVNENITIDAVEAEQLDPALAADVTEDRNELVIINSNIAEKETVLSQLGDGYEVLEIDPGQDAMSQIQDYLDAHSDTKYDAVHVLTHGNDQGFYLGSTKVTEADQMSVFNGHMADNGDFMLYGCNLASSEQGQSLVQDIADFTGCDVAASTNITGAAALGGDWILEYNTGVIETTNISLDADWNYRLANITVNSGAAASATNALSLYDALNGYYTDPGTGILLKASSGDTITISTATGGTTISTTEITIIANAKVSGEIIITTANVTLTGANYTDVTITGGIVNSDFTLSGTFTNNGTIQNSTVNTSTGTMVVNGGTITDSHFNSTGTSNGIQINNGTFNNSELNASGTSSGIRITGIRITGGNFTDTSITNSGSGGITISGGTFLTSPVVQSGTGSLSISDGTFNGGEGQSGIGVKMSGSGNLSISGGIFSNFETAVQNSSSEAQITGGTFTRNIYGIVNKGKMSIVDNTGNNILIMHNYEFSDGVYTQHGAGISNTGTLNVVRGLTTVQDNNYGIENSGTIENISSSTIDANHKSGIRNEGTIGAISNVTLQSNGFLIVEGEGYVTQGGGLYNSGIIENIRDITIINNYADQGGGLYNSGTIADGASNIYITGNTARQGGGIFLAGGYIAIDALTLSNGGDRGITGNTARQGGGIYVAGYRETLLLKGLTISSNIATGIDTWSEDKKSDEVRASGAGIYIAEGVDALLDTVTVSDNKAYNVEVINKGYWIYYYDGIDKNITNRKEVTDLGAVGGGIYNAGSVEIIRSEINGNSVSFLNGSQLPDYYAFLETLSMGGGIYSTGVLNVYDSYIHDNSANNGLGGGIYLGAGTAEIVTTEYFRGDSLWQLSDDYAQNAMVITGNSATSSSDGYHYAAGGFGGGIYADSSVNLTLDSVTIAENTASLKVTFNSGTYDIGRGGGLYFGEADAYRDHSNVTKAPSIDSGTLTIDGTVRDKFDADNKNIAELEMNRRASLIFANEAVSGSGLYINSGSTVTVNNTEVHENSNIAGSYFIDNKVAEEQFRRFVETSNQKDPSLQIKVSASDIAAAGKLFTTSGIGLYLGGTDATISLDGVSVWGNNENRMDALGGGIYVTGDLYSAGKMSLNLVNTTLYGNTALYGGGMYIGENASVNILNTTIAGNTANTAGGGVYIIGSNAAVNILNSILVGNIGDDLSAESNAPTMKDMYSLFGTISIKNSMTFQYEQQDADPTSNIGVKAKDIFAYDGDLEANFKRYDTDNSLQVQYAKEYTAENGEVYYYNYAYATTRNLAISAAGQAAYKGVYTAIDLASSVMYFNTLNSQSVAAGQTSGTWKNFNTGATVTVNDNNIITKGQNGLSRNASGNYSVYNIGAYQLMVKDVFYYDLAATNTLNGTNRLDHYGYGSDGYKNYTASGEYYVRTIVNTTDDTVNPYDGSLSLREAILMAGFNQMPESTEGVFTVSYTLDPTIYGENPAAPVISEKFHFSSDIVFDSAKFSGNGVFEVGESNIYGTAADGSYLTSSFYDSIGINKSLEDAHGNDIYYRILAVTVDATEYSIDYPTSSLEAFQYDGLDYSNGDLNLTLKVSDDANDKPGRFRIFDVISGDITLLSREGGSFTLSGGNVSNDNNPDRPKDERVDESIDNYGGVIRLSGAGAVLTLNSVTVQDGTANKGGGIYVADGVLNLIGNTSIKGNEARGFLKASDDVRMVENVGYMFTSGYGAGIYMAGGKLVVGMDAQAAEKAGAKFYASNVTITDNTAAYDGGGIYLSGTAMLTGYHTLYYYDVENKNYLTLDSPESFIVSSNSAVCGAGLYIATTGSVSLERATISGNTLKQGISTNYKTPTSGIPASQGGGIYISSGSSVILKGVTVSGNTTGEYERPGTGNNPDVPDYIVSYGGGIYSEGNVEITVSELKTSGNSSAMDVAGSSITGNKAVWGGGVYLAAGTFTMDGAANAVGSISSNTATGQTFQNEASNTTGQGGGIYVASGAKATLINVALSLNTAEYKTSLNTLVNTNGSNMSGRGGAVYNEGTFSLTNTSPSEIIISLNNNTAVYGGGIYQKDGVVSLSYLSMYGNSATGTTSAGAAFYLEKGTAELFNTTIAGNVSNGAAIYTNAGSLTLTNTTLALNTGSKYGLFNSDATVMLYNTLVIGNGSTGYENVKGTYSNDGYSLVGTKENGYSAELIFGTNVFDPNTGVIALSTDAQNPALTGGTLYRDSAGNAYDQLGNDRIVFPGEGKYSIGAFTASVIITIKEVNTFADDTDSANDKYSLREAIETARFWGDITIQFDIEALQNEIDSGIAAEFILENVIDWTSGTVTISGDLLKALSESVSIKAAGTTEMFKLTGSAALLLSNIVVDGNGMASAFSFTGTGKNELSGVTVKNTRNGAVRNAAELTITKATFEDNVAGSAAVIENSGVIKVTDTIFNNNSSDRSVISSESDLTVAGGAFKNNTGNGSLVMSNGIVTVNGTTFTGNTNAGDLITGQSVTVNSGSFTDNTGNQSVIDAGGDVTLMDASFRENESSDSVVVANGNVTVTGGSFTDNTGNQSVIDAGGDVTLENGVTFIENESSDSVVVAKGDITVNVAGFERNQGAGSLLNSVNGDVLIDGSIFTGNTNTGDLIIGQSITVNGGSFENNTNNTSVINATSGDVILMDASFRENESSDSVVVANGNVTVTGGSFTENIGNQSVIDAGGDVALENGVRFIGNESSDSVVSANGNVTVDGGSFMNNRGTGSLIKSNNTVTVNETTFTGNTNMGDLITGQSVTVNSGNFTDNTGNESVINATDSVTVQESVFHGNGTQTLIKGRDVILNESSIYENTTTGAIASGSNRLIVVSTTIAENSAALDLQGGDVTAVNSTIAEASGILIEGNNVQIANSIVVTKDNSDAVAGTEVAVAYSAISGKVNTIFADGMKSGLSYADVFGNNTLTNGFISLPADSPAVPGVWTAVDYDSSLVYYSTQPTEIWAGAYNQNTVSWNLLGYGGIGGKADIPASAVFVKGYGGLTPNMGAYWGESWMPDYGPGVNDTFVDASFNGIGWNNNDIYNVVADNLVMNSGFLLNFRNEMPAGSRLYYEFTHAFDDRYSTMDRFAVTQGRFDLGIIPSGETYITINVNGNISDDFTRYTTTPYLSDGTPLIPEELESMNPEITAPAEAVFTFPAELEEKVMSYLRRAEIFKDDYDKALDSFLKV